jgi:hypothetical protein
MDIDYLIDRLEALITNGKRVPLGNKIMVDEQQCLDLIDQMRAVLPEEIRAAKRTLHERERILGIAEEDAQHVVQRAEQERQHIIGREGLMAEVERQSDIILQASTEEAMKLRMDAQQMYDEALQQAQEMREGANMYAMQVLQELEVVLGKHLGMVQNGLQSFRQQVSQYQRELEQYHQNYRPDFAPKNGKPPTSTGIQKTTEKRTANNVPASAPPAKAAASGGSTSALPPSINNNRPVVAQPPNRPPQNTSGILRPVPKTTPGKDDKRDIDDDFLE